MSTEQNDHEDVVEMITSLIRGDYQGKKTVGWILYESLTRQIKRILHDPNARQYGRVAIVGNMKDHKLTDDQIFRIVYENNRWNDYNESITKYQISTIHGMKRTREDPVRAVPELTQRVSTTPPPSVQGSAQDNENLIHAVVWRSPDVQSTPQSIRHFFMNRTDIFAVQHAPTGKNKSWHYRTVKREVTDADIRNHLESWYNPLHADPFTIGAYEKGVDGKCKWLCFDIDQDDSDKGYVNKNMYLALLLCGFFEYHGISCLLENASRGFESYHVWVFCEPANIQTLQTIGKYAAQQCNVKCEVFPKASYESDIGNLVRLPFSLNRKKQTRSRNIPYDKNQVIPLYTYTQALLRIHA